MVKRSSSVPKLNNGGDNANDNKTSNRSIVGNSSGSVSGSISGSGINNGGNKKSQRSTRKSVTPTQFIKKNYNNNNNNNNNSKNNNKNNNNNQNNNKKNNDSIGVINRMIPRSRSLTHDVERRRCTSPKVTSGSTTISRNTPIFLSSRENQIDSADTLETVASKSTGSQPHTPEDNINVVVRVRPLNDKEKREKSESMLQFPGNGQVLIQGTSSPKSISESHHRNIRIFTYNVVFEPGATQTDILDYSGIKRIIEMAVKGFSCTAFCYGQTGSGKTHTLTGPPDLFIEKPTPNDQRHGLIFRSFVYLFELIKNHHEVNFIIKASFLEIYNERVIDLLNPSTTRKPLAVRWSKKLGGFYVENLFTIDCEELDDLLAVLEEGMRNRAVGSHAMNDHSSRSHTILTVEIKSEQETEDGVFISKHGKINFVDLAGSELTKKTLSNGKTMEEANNINKSLMVLGYCIASLSDSKKRLGHIPYRDSQLTKLLADSLAGNGVTLMIACVSPAPYNFAETLNTLRYASRAKRIRSKPIVIMDPREALILSLKRDLNALYMENEHLKAALRLYHHQQEQQQQKQQQQQHRLHEPTNDKLNVKEYENDNFISSMDNGLIIPKIDIERLPELDGSELAELVKLYMQENEALRQENQHLFTVRETILRDQEIVCRENERLLKKLEDVNSVCVRSPVIPAQSVLISADGREEMPNSEIWTNPDDLINDKQSSLTTANTDNKNNNNRNKNTAIRNQQHIARNILKMANTLNMQRNYQ